MNPAPAAAAPLPYYVVRLSDALAALLGAEGAAISEGGGELSEDELVDGLRTARLIIHPSPPTAQHPAAPAAHPDNSASHPSAPAAAADADAEAEGAPKHRVVRLAGAIAALLGHTEGAEITEDEAGAF
jgi:hypothetical protein